MSASDELKGWIAGRIPKEWFSGAPEVRSDRDEIWVIGTLGDVALPGDAGPEAANAARTGRIKQYREDTRDLRMRIAEEAEQKFGQAVLGRPLWRCPRNVHASGGARDDSAPAS